MEQGNWPPEPEKAGTEGVETEDALGQRPIDAGDGQGEGTPADARPGRRRRLGIAVAAVACGLGVAAAVALTQGSPSPDPVAEAPAAQTEQAEDATETDLTGDDGTARVAVRNTPGSAATTTAADPSSDASVEAAVEGSDGWAMDDDTYQGLGGDPVVAQSGGTTPTSPDGTEVVAPSDADGTDGAGDAEGAAGDGAEASDGATAPSGGDSSAGDAQSGGPSSGSPSSGAASSTQPSSGGSSSGSTSSGQTSSGSSSSGSQQSHAHDWQPVYQSVWVQDSAAWDEPTYSTVTKIRCSTCGTLFDTVDECIVHGDVHGDDFSYSSVAVKVQTGTKHHDATGHYEQRVTGYRCATCGATK